MVAKDKLLPLVWMYWERHKQELVKRFGYKNVGSRLSMMKWLSTEDGDILNIVKIGAIMGT